MSGDRRRQAMHDAGLIQLGPNLKPEKHVSYDVYNAGDGPQPVVCLRCADGPSAVPSVRDVCVKCFAAVWVSRRTEAAMTHMRQPEILGSVPVTCETPRKRRKNKRAFAPSRVIGTPPEIRWSLKFSGSCWLSRLPREYLHQAA
jgi:hypothetical protein